MTWDEIRDRLIHKFPNLRPALADELASFCLRLYEQGREDQAKQIADILNRVEETK
jgi:hypothetical protein